MKRKFYYIIFFLFFVGIFVNLVFGEENLIPNGGFEECKEGIPTKKGWNPSPYPMSSLQWTSDEVHSGKYSLKIIEKSEKPDVKIKGWSSDNIPIDSSFEYQFEGYIKTSNFSEKGEGVWGKAAIYYYWLDKDNKFIGDAHYIILQGGTTDWKKVSAILKPIDPSKVKGIKIVAAVYSGEQPNGIAWFDDFTLTKIISKKKVDKGVKLELIGSVQYPHGWGVDFVKKGNYIFQSKSESNLKLAVIDVSNPSHMRLITEIEGGAYAVRNLCLCEKENILLCNAYQKIIPIDISNPEKPVELMEYIWQPDEYKDKIPPFYQFGYKDGFIFLLCAELKKAIRVYTIEKPFKPILVATVNLDQYKDEEYTSFVSKNWYPNEILIDKDLLFASFGNLLAIVDISNPNSPNLINVYKAKENIESITKYENKLFLCLSGRKNSVEIKEGNEKILVFDISNPAELKEVCSYKKIYIPERILAVKDRLFVVGLEKIPEEIASSLPKTLIEKYKYIPTINILDISSLPEIKILDKTYLPLRILPYNDSICRKIMIEKDSIFVADHNFGIRCFNIKNDKIKEISNIRTITQETNAMVFTKYYVYIAGPNSLIPINISNIKNPTIKRENIIFFPGFLGETYEHKLPTKYIYFICKDLKNIIVVNIENEEKPYISGFVKLPDDVGWYYVHEIGDYIYVIGNGEKERLISMLILSIRNKGEKLDIIKRIDLKPELKEGESVNSIIQRGICIEDNFLYLLGYGIIKDNARTREGSEIFTFDISNPAEPKLLGNCFLEGVIPGGALSYGGPGIYKKILYFFTHPEMVENRKISYFCSIDMKEPNNPVLISKKIIEDHDYFFKTVGYSGRVLTLPPYPYLVIQEYFYGMRLVDIKKPEDPVIVWEEECKPSKFGEFYPVYGWGRMLYRDGYIFHGRLDHLDIFKLNLKEGK